MCILHVACSFYFNIICCYSEYLGDYHNANHSCSCLINVITALVFLLCGFSGKKGLFCVKINPLLQFSSLKLIFSKSGKICMTN